MRKHLASVLLLLFIPCNSIAQESVITNIGYTSDFHSASSDADKAIAFANWYSRNQFTYFEGTRIKLAETGISLENLMQANGHNTDETGFLTFSSEMNYFSQLDSVYRKKMEIALQGMKTGAERKWNENFRSPGIYIWAEQTADPHKFTLYACQINESEKKTFPLKVTFENSSAIVNNDGPFRKTNGRCRKFKPGPTEISYQTFERKDSGEVIIRFSLDGKVSSQITVPHLATSPPFIREYFVSDNVITEGEKSTITWDVFGADEVTLDDGIGRKYPRAQITVAPETTKTYTITASNKGGSTQKEVTVEVERVYLKNIQVSFFSPLSRDGKMQGSTIHFSLNNSFGDKVAEMSCCGEIAFIADLENKYYGPFIPQINRPVLKKELRSGSMEISIEAAIPDLWEFSPIVVLEYTNTTKESLYGYGIKTLRNNTDKVVIDF